DAGLRYRFTYPHRNAVLHEFRADFGNVADFGCKQEGVLLAETDRPSVRESFVRLGRLSGPYDDDPVTHAVHVFAVLLFETDAEGEEHDDGDGAPRDAEHGKYRAEPLRSQILNELLQCDEIAHGRGRLLDLFQFFFFQALAFLEPADDFDVDGVAKAGLYLQFLSRSVFFKQRDARRIVRECDDPFGDHQDVLPLFDDDVGVGRIASAKCNRDRVGFRMPWIALYGFGDLDLDREDSAVLFLFGFEPDFRNDALDGRIGQRADVQLDLHAFPQAADVDFVHGTAENEVLHVRHRHEDG